MRPATRGAFVALGVALLVGCASVGDTPVDESTDTTSGVALETESVLELELGACVNDADTPLRADLAEVPTVPCSEPHDSELYAIIPVMEGPYPGVDDLVDEGQNRCRALFDDFVGSDFRSSLLDFHFYYPTPSSWAQGDRKIYCMVFDPGLRVVGTLQGSRR